MNNRRKLLVVLGAGVLAAPLASFSQQQGKVWRVGFLTSRSRPDTLDSDIFGAFRQGMRELGYVEGKNLTIEWRFADGDAKRLPGLAAELASMKVDAIVTHATPAASAAQKATTSIPIVMGSVGDPVGSGFVKSLARPGGNMTGLSNVTGEVSTKHLEMLLGAVPKLSRVGVLVHPDNSGHATILKNVQAAAQKVNVKILPADARTLPEIENAVAMMIREKVGAVILVQAPIFAERRRQIAELMAKNRLPSITSFREYAEVGGLMSYGQDLARNFRRAATYVDKILKGAKPADLPVEQPTKFDLLINGKTAKALGLTIPPSLLISADKVIE